MDACDGQDDARPLPEILGISTRCNKKVPSEK